MAFPESIRTACLERDRYTCRACGFRDKRAVQADHGKPESLGGPDTLENAQCLCGVCNNLKGNTNTGILPQRPRPCGFGDAVEVEANRQAFEHLLTTIRAAEYAAILADARQWKSDGVRGLTIRKRINGRLNRKPDATGGQTDEILALL